MAVTRLGRVCNDPSRGGQPSVRKNAWLRSRVLQDMRGISGLFRASQAVASYVDSRIRSFGRYIGYWYAASRFQVAVSVHSVRIVGHSENGRVRRRSAITSVKFGHVNWTAKALFIEVRRRRVPTGRHYTETLGDHLKTGHQ